MAGHSGGVAAGDAGDGDDDGGGDDGDDGNGGVPKGAEKVREPLPRFCWFGQRLLLWRLR
jgi:hypothetical protein